VAAALDRAWQKADAVVAISALMASRLRARAPRANVQTIPLWAPDDVRCRADRSRSLRRSRAIRDDAFVVMYHGNLGLAYDFDPILRAARAMAGDPRVTFVIVGDGAQRSELVARAARERLENVRFFPGTSASELGESIAMGDCHIIGIRPGMDGLAFPSKFVAAIAAGRPVIVLGEPDTELANIVRRHQCGVVASSDGQALAAAIGVLRDGRDVVERLGAAARALYEHEFDREKGLARWDALLSTNAPRSGP
jgi:glycosyltransferase involved in cell wall biosynthesis